MWVPFALYDECSWHSPFILVILVNVVIVEFFLSVLSLLLSLLSCLVILLDVGNVAVVVAAADE